jgi:hypothetical protein
MQVDEVNVGRHALKRHGAKGTRRQLSCPTYNAGNMSAVAILVVGAASYEILAVDNAQSSS